MVIEAMLLENLFGSEEVVIQIGRFLVALAVGIILTRAAVMPATEKLLFKRKDEKTLQSIVNIVGITGLFLSMIVALQAGSFGNLTTILGAIAAALTVAVGFGMRDQVGNLVSGIFIHFDNPFLKGDYIKVGETEGVVKEINLRDTVLNGKNVEKTVIPNSTLMNNPLQNFTKGSKTKTAINVKINTEKLEEHREILDKVAESNEKILEKPQPELVFMDVQEPTAELRYWIKDPEKSKQIRSEVIEEYLKRVEEKGLRSEKKESEQT